MVDRSVATGKMAIGWHTRHFVEYKLNTRPKTNMDAQNDSLEKVTPFKNGNLLYLC